MDTKKTCYNCRWLKSPTAKAFTCDVCIAYSAWKADEETTKEYMERCLPGESAYDIINKPKHYMLFEDKGIEVRDVCAQLVNKVREGSNVPFWKEASLFESDYVQLMQYLMRFMDKNGVEDLKKARFYLDKLIEAY